MRRIAAIAGLLLLLFFPATAIPGRAQSPNVCSFLPAGMEIDGPVYSDGKVLQGDLTPTSVVEVCNGSFSGSNIWIGIYLYRSPDPASKGIQSDLNAKNGWKESTGYGDRVLECKAPAYCLKPGFSGGLSFSRGCYLVDGGWDATTEQRTRGYLSTLDERLKSASCLGGTAQAPPPNSLGVTLSCEHEFDDPGLVKCAAQAVHPQPNAAITYDWSFDGAAQGATGTELDLTGVKSGPHSAAVTARDTNNNLTSERETVSFTKGASGEASSAPNAGGGAPPLGSWSSAAPAGVPSAASNVPNASSGGPNINPTTLFAGILGLGVVLGAAVGTVGIARRRRNGGSSPAASAAPSASPPAAPAADPKPQTPASNAPAGPAVSTQQRQQNKEVLWLTADPQALTVHGDTKDSVQVRITASKSVNDVVSDASGEVRVSVQAPADDKHVIIEQIDNLTYTVKGVHVGVMPHDCTLAVTGVSLKTGTVAVPAQVSVRVMPVKVEVRVGVIKKGFSYQELVTTIPDICRTVTGSVAATDPSDFFDPELGDFGADYGLDAPASADTQQAVAGAHCSISLRADGHAWTEPKPASTDEKGQFRFQLLRRFSELLGAESVEYRLPMPVKLFVNSEVKTSLRTYFLEFGAFARQTSDVSEGAFPGDSPLADARSECLDYPHRFFVQLCARSEDDYGRLLGALNLLRGSIIFASKYRAGFKDQRAYLNVIADDVYGPIIDVILAAPISSNIVKWLSGERIWLEKLGRAVPTPKEIILAIAGKLVKVPGGKMALWVALLPFRLARYAFRGALKQLAAWYPKVMELAAKVGASPSYLQAMAEELAAGGATPAGETAIANLKAGCSNETEVMVASAFGDIARELLSFGSALKNLLFTFAHVLLLLTALVIKTVAAGIIAPMAALGYEGAREFFGELMDNLWGWYPDFYAKVANWLESFRTSGAQQTPRKSFCDSVLDKIWSLNDMDRVLAGGLDTAYQGSVRLELSDDWLAAINRVSKKEVELMSRWTRDYTRGYSGEGQDRTDIWGWVTIGEVLSPWVETIAKLIQIICFCWAMLIEAGVKLALRLGLKLFGSILAEGPLGLTSWTDLIVDCVRAVFRVGVFGVETYKLYTLYELLPDRVKDLYSRA